MTDACSISNFNAYPTFFGPDQGFSPNQRRDLLDPGIYASYSGSFGRCGFLFIGTGFCQRGHLEPVRTVVQSGSRDCIVGGQLLRAVFFLIRATSCRHADQGDGLYRNRPQRNSSTRAARVPGTKPRSERSHGNPIRIAP